MKVTIRKPMRTCLSYSGHGAVVVLVVAFYVLVFHWVFHNSLMYADDAYILGLAWSNLLFQLFKVSHFGLKDYIERLSDAASYTSTKAGSDYLGGGMGEQGGAWPGNLSQNMPSMARYLGHPLGVVLLFGVATWYSLGDLE